MANTLSKSLGLNLADLAEMIRSKGRGKDTILAHITPKEAALLKRRGGRGSINPYTGLLEYDDGEDFSGASVDVGPAPDIPAPDVNVAAPDVSVPAPDVGSVSQDPNYYGVPDGGQYQPYVDPSAGYTGPDFSTMPDQAAPQPFAYPPNASPGFNALQDLNYDPAGPGVLPSTGLPGTPAQVAQEYPQLYPGGRLPTAGEQTVFTPTGDPYYEKATPIPEKPGTTKDGKPTDYSGLLSQLLRLGLGAGTAYGLTRGVAQPAAKTAADQAQQAKTDRLNIATPYQNIGKNLISGAQAGNLSASNIQAIKAARAMAAQNISRTGGVGVLQGANSIADLEARLLDNQLTQGVKIANIGDNYAIGAIQAGQAADTALAQSQANFANQLATMLAPMVLGYAPQIGNQAIKSGGNLLSNPSLTTTDTSTPASPTSGEITA